LKTDVDHSPERSVLDAHSVQILRGSRLSRLIDDGRGATELVNSSHHQAVLSPGDNLVVTAVSVEDGVIEAVELDAPDHFVVGVQWHPERTYTHSQFSRAIFAAFIQAADAWSPRAIEESVSAQA
jgi:putative glutamine amidotransferase